MKSVCTDLDFLNLAAFRMLLLKQVASLSPSEKDKGLKLLCFQMTIIVNETYLAVTKVCQPECEMSLAMTQMIIVTSSIFMRIVNAAAESKQGPCHNDRQNKYSLS